MNNFFIFKFFNELQIGDVFKFSPIIDNDIPNKFYTVYQKNETTTKFNATYGKELNQKELLNDTKREVMIYTNRKKNRL